MKSPYGRRFNLREAATFLDCTPDQLYRLIRLAKITYQRTSARIPGKTRGSNYVFYEQDLLTFLDQTRVVAAQPGLGLRTGGRNIDHLMPAERELG